MSPSGVAYFTERESILSAALQHLEQSDDKISQAYECIFDVLAKSTPLKSHRSTKFLSKELDRQKKFLLGQKKAFIRHMQTVKQRSADLHECPQCNINPIMLRTQQTTSASSKLSEHHPALIKLSRYIVDVVSTDGFEELRKKKEAQKGESEGETRRRDRDATIDAEQELSNTRPVKRLRFTAQNRIGNKIKLTIGLNELNRAHFYKGSLSRKLISADRVLATRAVNTFLCNHDFVGGQLGSYLVALRCLAQRYDAPLDISPDDLVKFLKWCKVEKENKEKKKENLRLNVKGKFKISLEDIAAIPMNGIPNDGLHSYRSAKRAIKHAKDILNSKREIAKSLQQLQRYGKTDNTLTTARRSGETGSCYLLAPTPPHMRKYLRFKEGSMGFLVCQSHTIPSAPVLRQPSNRRNECLNMAAIEAKDDYFQLLEPDLSGAVPFKVRKVLESG